jgi:hypothetical protein
VSERTKATEAQISRSIMDLLSAKHVFAMRMNSGTRIGEHNGKKWAIHMHAPGTADILAISKNIWRKESQLPILWIEVKDATGKQSELQKSFQMQVEEEGHQYIIARSIEDVEKYL